VRWDPGAAVRAVSQLNRGNPMVAATATRSGVGMFAFWYGHDTAQKGENVGCNERDYRAREGQSVIVSRRPFKGQTRKTSSARSLEILFHEASQPLDRPQISHAGRRFGQIECLRDLSIRQLLVVSHDDDFVVRLPQFPDRLLYPLGQLLLGGGGGGGHFVILEPMRQHNARLLAPSWCGERLLSVDAPFGRTTVPSEGVDHAIFGDLAQPEVKAHTGVADVVLQTPIRFDQDILQHVANVHAALDSLVQPHPNQLSNGVAMSFQ
jgi:hypothetical protein